MAGNIALNGNNTVIEFEQDGLKTAIVIAHISSFAQFGDYGIRILTNGGEHILTLGSTQARNTALQSLSSLF